MASPWKMLSRWVSRRRQSALEEGSPDGDRDGALVAPPVQIPQGQSPRLPTDEEQPPPDQSNASATEAQRKLDAESSAHPNANIEENLEPPNAYDPVTTGDVETQGHRAAMPARSPRGKRPGTGRKVPKADGEGIPGQTGPVTSTAYNHLDLDDEIKMLRNQLAIKLQLQNEQLKKMLERFDR